MTIKAIGLLVMLSVAGHALADDTVTLLATGTSTEMSS